MTRGALALVLVTLAVGPPDPPKPVARPAPQPPAAPRVAAAEPAGVERPVSVMKDVYPFLKRHCVSCHNAAAPRASQPLTDYQDAASIRRDRAVWDDVLLHVEAGSMPPAGERQPTAAEAAAFARTVRRLRAQADDH